MDITIKIDAETKLEFRVEQVSNRQNQPLDLADRERWKDALRTNSAWQQYRWDMFMVDVLVSIHDLESRLAFRVELNGQQHYFGSGSSYLRLERFFIQPNLQNPAEFDVQHQPNCMDTQSEVIASNATRAWFIQQPQYKQMVAWAIAAMNKMREVLVLADQFDTDWWAKYQENVEEIEASL